MKYQRPLVILAASLLLGLGLVSAVEDVSERALLLTQKSVGSEFSQVDVDNLLVEAYAVYTNKTTTGAMRGFGAPQVCFAYESQMDEIAQTLGIDPLEIRLRNAFSENSLSPTSQVLQSVALKESLLQATDRFGWKE